MLLNIESSGMGRCVVGKVVPDVCLRLRYQRVFFGLLDNEDEGLYSLETSGGFHPTQPHMSEEFYLQISDKHSILLEKEKVIRSLELNRYRKFVLRIIKIPILTENFIQNIQENGKK
jgi:hypothetical protein